MRAVKLKVLGGETARIYFRFSDDPQTVSTDTPRTGALRAPPGYTLTLASPHIHSCPDCSQSCAHSRLATRRRGACLRLSPARCRRASRALRWSEIASDVVGGARSPQWELLLERSGVARGWRGPSASSPRAEADAARARWRGWRRRGWRRPKHGAREPQPKAWRDGRRPGWCPSPGWCEADTGCRGEAACGRWRWRR